MLENTPRPALPDLPSNVVGSRGAPFEGHQEEVFLSRVFDSLRKEMGDDFHTLTFVVHRRVHGDLPGREINLDPGGPGRVLIIISDECEVFPVNQFPGYQAVFRAYGAPDGIVSSAGIPIQSFPVGYLNSAGLQRPIPFDEREISVFFSGYLNSSRVDLYKQFNRLWWLPKANIGSRHIREVARRLISRFHPQRNFDGHFPGAKIGFTSAFGKGLSPSDYAETLANSKIALCPQGFVSSETIRHWEAMRLGCVIISAPLPDSPFYKGSPIIQVEDWCDLEDCLHKLLSDQDRLASLHNATVKWWIEHCSEEAVAKKMASILLT